MRVVIPIGQSCKQSLNAVPLPGAQGAKSDLRRVRDLKLHVHHLCGVGPASKGPVLLFASYLMTPGAHHSFAQVRRRLRHQIPVNTTASPSNSTFSQMPEWGGMSQRR